MKSKRIMPIFAAVLALSIAGRAWAIVERPPEDEDGLGMSASENGAISVSAGFMTQLQTFFQTGPGTDVLAKAPGLGFIQKLNPRSDFHRRLIGTLGLSASFAAQLKRAIKTSDNKALGQLGARILSAYQTPGSEGVGYQGADRRIASMVLDQADKIQADLKNKKIDPRAAAELVPFVKSSISARQAVIATVLATRAAGVQDAQRMAALLSQNKVTADDSLSYLYYEDGVEAAAHAAGQAERLKPAGSTVKAGASEQVPGSAQAATPETMDVATMQKLFNGFKTLNGRTIYNGGDADADLLRSLAGQKRQAQGVLEMDVRPDWSPAYEAYTYLREPESPNRVLIAVRGFWFKNSALNYRKSLDGKQVVVDFTVNAPGRMVASSPFVIEKITPVDAPSALPAKTASAAPVNSKNSEQAKAVKIYSQIFAPLMLVSGAVFGVFGLWLGAAGIPLFFWAGMCLAGGAALAMAPLAVSSNRRVARIFNQAGAVLMSASLVMGVLGIVLIAMAWAFGL